MALPPAVQVATDALRTEATVWDQQSRQMGTIAGKADGLRFNRVQAGVFQLVVGPYVQLVDQVRGRCEEGAQRMTEIGNALRQTAATYEKEELDGTHRLKNLR
jgi:phage tail tube protein FII